MIEGDLCPKVFVSLRGSSIADRWVSVSYSVDMLEVFSNYRLRMESRQRVLRSEHFWLDVFSHLEE